MKNKIIIIAKIAIGVPLIIFVVGYITMSLWNWLVPALFHGPEINLWQTFGIILLSKILFGGFKGKGGGCCCGNGGGNPREAWKQHLKAKWNDLSNEERSNLKNKFFSKCYPRPEDEHNQTETPNK